MKSVFEIAITYAPEVLAGIFPFIRILRGGRALTSFFLCWGLVVFWTFVFAIAPVVAGFVSTSVSHELDSWTPGLYIPIAMVFSGWYSSSVTILLGLIFRLFGQRLNLYKDQQKDRSNQKSDQTGIIALSVIVIFVTAWLFVFPISRPPREADFLQNFYAHRTAFEELREMLQAEPDGFRVASWGVDTGNGLPEPPGGNFPIKRFDRYLALLKEAGGTNGIRRKGIHPMIGILMWGQGFAGDTVHIGICWQEIVPTRQVENLDVYFHDHKSSGTRGWVYKHIDGNWYLFTDIATGS
ncbi:MAG: hypothetical protein WCD79_01570 [Chthoniobacteraceae bacterium]